MRVLGRPVSSHPTKPVAGLLLAALLAPAAAAQVAERPATPLDPARVLDPRLRPSPRLAPDAAAGAVTPEVGTAWEEFRRSAGGQWQAQFDAANGRLAVAEGAGIPWVPGRGNRLTLADLAPLLSGKPEPDLATLEIIARGFFPRVASLLGAAGASLVLDRGRSGRFSDYLWYVDFGVVRNGLPVEGAHVVFRVNHGNLVQFGAERLPDPGAPVPAAELSREEALAALKQHVGGFGPGDTWVDPGSLRLLPAEERGRRGLLAAWQFAFRRKGVPGTWQGRVEATSGEVIEFLDVNAYAGATGGVYPSSPAVGGEALLPMPFADVSSGGPADSAGIYPFNPAGGPVTSTLAGPYVRIADQCGPVSLESTAAGNLRFRSSAGTNCATPGVGGAGNTHSARTQFFHLNRIKEAGRGWLPTNTWLAGQLTANLNLNQTCNAYWDGSAVNFFRSGGGCGNTGEIAGVSLHEYGHGLDQNDGAGFSTDNGSGEAYADVISTLALRDSCMGPGFRSGNCGAYGDACTACTGIRDIDWGRHLSNTPHTVANFAQPRCNFGFYPGPCGGEGHCESHVASEAIWDLVARDLPDPGSPAAWAVAERLWYLSRPTATHAFTCNTSTSTWTSNGCAAGSWWRTLRAVDDDDGNLANGTPHSCQLFAAFDRHGIACAADPGANVCAAACTPPTAPAVTLTPGDGQVQVSWTSAGPGVVYDVYRGDTGCGTGKVRIANDLAATTSLLDSHVANGIPYAYEVIAHPAGSEACAAAPSECQTATPAGVPCTPPAVPALTAAPAGFGSIELSWTASAGAVSYQVSRGTAAGGPYLPIATVTGTTFTDGGLDEATTYRYVVAAVDAEDCASADSAEAAATTPTCNQVALYENDFESGEGFGDWTVGTLPNHFGGASDWRGSQDCAAHGGARGFRFGGDTCAAPYDAGQATYAQPPAIEVPAGVGRVRLSFWHRWAFEGYYDGGSLTLALDGGAPVQVPAAALSGAAYNGTRFDGTPVFTNFQSAFVETVADLDRVCDLASGGSGGCAGHTVTVRFVALTDSIVQYDGWILDDVEVTACGPDCEVPGAPSGTGAVPAGDNQAQVSWSGGAPAAVAFNVYRAEGTCAAPGAFKRVARRVAGSPVTDTGLQGTLTYAYRVTGTDVTGFCESAPSPCAEVTATGPCTLAPGFAGLASATNPGATACALDLAWNAATSRCPGAVTYDVFRSAAPDFLPSAANRIASGLTGTTYRDASPLADRATFWYVVRAVNALSGVADGNLVRRDASPTGPSSQVTLAESFEAAGGFDLDGWEHQLLFGPNDWVWTGQRSQSPSHSWLSPSYSSYADRVLISPRFVPGPATELRFWHTYEFENPFTCFDGGTLEVSADAGASWQPLSPSAFLAGGYNGYASAPAIGGEPAWCGGTLGPMTEVRADLSAWQGEEVRLRWHGAEDGSVKYTGWFVDSVTISDVDVVAACSSAPPPATSFYTVSPCRLVDTRGAFEVPLQPNEVRTLALANGCGVPETAVALSVNVTVTLPMAGGHLTLFPANRPAPQTSTINFRAGQTRANNALISLAPDGHGSVKVQAVTGGTVHLIVDVNGYFQ